jgi:XTP/dITP diphosphohydrolase
LLTGACVPAEHEGGPPGRAGRVILLVTSPRVAPGLLSLRAWQALQGAARVLCGTPGHPQGPALTGAGIAWEVVTPPAGGAGPGDAGAGAGPARDGGGGEGPQERAAALAATLADAAAGAGGPVVWLADPGRVPGSGSGDAVAPEELLGALRALPGGGPQAEVLHGSHDLPGARLLDLVATMDILRTACPWDARQTHESLAPHLLEEPYEALEALESGNLPALREELGDVLLQVLFHARIAAERDDGTGFTIDDVADGIVAKLVRRHPHVFGDVTVSGADEVKRNWDAIKRAERAARASRSRAPSSSLDDVPFGQPALALAAQLQRRAARAGVPDSLLGMPRDEQAAPAGGRPAAGDQGTGLGDTLFRLVAEARRAGLDPELELRAAARRFRDRVRAWEQAQRQDSA